VVTKRKIRRPGWAPETQIRTAALLVVSAAVVWALVSGALAASGASPAALVAASRSAEVPTGAVTTSFQASAGYTQFGPDVMPGNGRSPRGDPSDAGALAVGSGVGTAQSPLNPLLARIAPLVDRFPAAAGVAVIDLQTGDRGGLNARQQFQAASTIKFYAALSAFRDVADGIYPLDGIRADLAATMQRESNAAARSLTNRTGIPVINVRLAHWGLEDTIITHPAGYEDEPHPSYLETDNQNWTSPSDAAHALSALYHGELLGTVLSRTLIDELTQTPRWFGIEGAVPDGEGHVYYKHGYLPAFDEASVNDIGIVEFDRGGRTYAYAIAIYTQGAIPQQPAWDLVRAVALKAWEFFANERYPNTTANAPALASTASP